MFISYFFKSHEFKVYRNFAVSLLLLFCYYPLRFFIFHWFNFSSFKFFPNVSLFLLYVTVGYASLLFIQKETNHYLFAKKRNDWGRFLTEEYQKEIINILKIKRKKQKTNKETIEKDKRTKKRKITKK